jgi:hypothetical protein
MRHIQTSWRNNTLEVFYLEAKRRNGCPFSFQTNGQSIPDAERLFALLISVQRWYVIMCHLYSLSFDHVANPPSHRSNNQCARQVTHQRHEFYGNLVQHTRNHLHYWLDCSTPIQTQISQPFQLHEVYVFSKLSDSSDHHLLQTVVFSRSVSSECPSWYVS